MSTDHCSKCPYRSSSPQRHPIPGDGPTPSRVLFIGEGPARDEARRHKVFVGRAGREFNGYYLTLAFPRAEIPRAECRITNAVKCPQPRFDNPTKEIAAECASRWLPGEVHRARPQIIVPMGAIACSLIEPHIDLESQHGIPFLGSLMGYEAVIYPTYHPAIGLHEGAWMTVMREDFEELGRFLNTYREGMPLGPVNHHPEPLYRELKTAEHVEDVFWRARAGGIHRVALDTEAYSLRGKEPYCFSFSMYPGTGCVIFMDRPEAVAAFCRCAAQLDPLWIFHNYLYDKSITEEIGIPVRRYDDTMIRAYHLQNLPQGLKPLAYRLAGLRMRNFDDVVRPYALEVAADYLAETVMALGPQLLTNLGKKGQPLKNERPLPDANKLDIRSYRKVEKILREVPGSDPWKRWDGWKDRDRDLITTTMGQPLPRPSIAQVPRSECVDYAAQDADATLRILAPLKVRDRLLREAV